MARKELMLRQVEMRFAQSAALCRGIRIPSSFQERIAASFPQK
jgi:hypothetical protein